MIYGILHRGSGIGNQLHRYVMTRVLAMDKGLSWGMIAPGLFKGYSFLNLDMGEECPFPIKVEFPSGRTLVESDWPRFQEDTSDYDWKGIETIKDNMIIDGEWQGEEYWEHHRDKIDSWLKVEPLDLGENVCIIGFRGGEYQYVPELFLTVDYWNKAIEIMVKENPNMIFKVVTDDPDLARVFFPNYEIQHEVGKDWRSFRYAKYLILSNSSFSIFPAWLNTECKKIIAPKGWARRNTGGQMLKYNEYKRFMHI